jgi:hypothetical protein
MKKMILFLFGIILVNGCIGSAPTDNTENLKQSCIQACENALDQERDLNNGPCLLDPMSDPEWVCDVAHDPREAVDNLRENQCDAWHAGTAKHFIEVTPDCKFIKHF